MDSSAMHHLLETVGNMTGTRTELEMELAAAKTLQRHARGWLARRRAQTRRGITEGVLAHTARGAVLSVPEGGLIATKIAKERMRKRVARRPLQRSTTLSATHSQAPASTAREQAQVRRERNWRGVYTARDDDVYEADIDKAKFQRVAADLVEQLTTLPLLQNVGKQEELGSDAFAAQIDEDAIGQPGDDSRLASIERSVAAIQQAQQSQQALLERMTERETKLEGMVRSLAEQTSHAMLLQAGFWFPDMQVGSSSCRQCQKSKAHRNSRPANRQSHWTHLPSYKRKRLAWTQALLVSHAFWCHGCLV